MYYNNDALETMPIPSINDNELLIKVQGQRYLRKRRNGMVPHQKAYHGCSDMKITGDIVKKEKNVTQYQVGDRVFVSHHVPTTPANTVKTNTHTLCHTLHTTNFYPGGFARTPQCPRNQRRVRRVSSSRCSVIMRGVLLSHSLCFTGEWR